MPARGGTQLPSQILGLRAPGPDLGRAPGDLSHNSHDRPHWRLAAVILRSLGPLRPADPAEGRRARRRCARRTPTAGTPPVDCSGPSPPPTAGVFLPGRSSSATGRRPTSRSSRSCSTPGPTPRSPTRRASPPYSTPATGVRPRSHDCSSVGKCRSPRRAGTGPHPRPSNRQLGKSACARRPQLRTCSLQPAKDPVRTPRHTISGPPHAVEDIGAGYAEVVSGVGRTEMTDKWGSYPHPGPEQAMRHCTCPVLGCVDGRHASRAAMAGRITGSVL
jgi:hypothetical protein